MSNTITAYFKGRIGVAESVYQNDYGIVMAFDSIELPAHFDCYFTVSGSDTSIPGVGADNRVVIPNTVLSTSGKVEVHIPLHTGENDSEVEYVAYFKVIGRARPEDDGTPSQMTAIEQALALLQQPITNIEQIVNEALSFTGDTFDEMQEALDEWKGGVEDDFDTLEAQFNTAVAAVTTDTEVTNIRVGADGVTDTTAGASVRRQFTNLKNDLNKVATIDEVISVNVFDKTKATRNGYLNGSGTVNESTNPDYGYSDYIDVSEGDFVRFYFRSQLAIFPGCMYYSDNTTANIKTASDFTEADANGQPSSFTVPSGVTKIRINIRWGYINEYMVTINNAWPDSYVPFEMHTRINDDVVIPQTSIKGWSNLYDKNIMFCGDSITYGAYADTDALGNRKNFGYYIEKSTGCHSLYDAISGSTMMNVAGKNPFSVDRYQQLGNNLDYIVLAFSANDSAESNDLIGSYSDSTNATFWGAWKIVLSYLIANYPTAKIGIIAFWRGNQAYQYTDALRKIAQKFRIPILDFMFDENVPMVGGTDFRSYNPNAPFIVDYNTLVARQDTFLHDTVHPNDAGYRYIAPIIQSYLERL